jgi:hypothetical protein
MTPYEGALRAQGVVGVVLRVCGAGNIPLPDMEIRPASSKVRGGETTLDVKWYPAISELGDRDELLAKVRKAFVKEGEDLEHRDSPCSSYVTTLNDVHVDFTVYR